MATNLVRPLKDNPDEAYETPLDKDTDGVAAAGFFPQTSSTNDMLAGVERDLSGNLTFKDPVLGLTKTLTQLATASSGFDPTKPIMEESGSLVYIDDGDILLVL